MMEGTIKLLLIAIGLVACQAQNPCPPQNEYYHSYEHESDCSKFYICDWGVPIEHICPLRDTNGNRLVFNPTLQVCDWPDQAIVGGAKCTGSPPVTAPPVTLPPVTNPPITNPPITNPPVTPAPSVCPPNNEYYHSYPHETDCHKFYVCDWGNSIEKICPFADANGNRLVFNPILQVCDWYDSAVAAGAVCPGGPPVTPPPVTLPPVTLPPVTLPPVTLPPVTLPPVTLPPVTLPPVTLPPNPCPPNNEYYHSYPHETDCHKYYVCDWGKPIEMICPFADANGNRLVFNPILQVCDWYDSAVAAGAVCPGGPPVTPPPVTLPPVTLPPVTLPPVTLPPVTLPPVTLPPVTLPPVTLPPVTLPPVTLPPNPCPPNNEYYHSYPHETDCHKYYVCDWGKPIEMICPFADANGNRLVFNPILQVCDWYDSAVAAGAVCPGGPPVTPPPVTLPPVTLPPVTLPPVTLPPVTLPPVTLPPVTLPPVTQPPGPCPPNNEYYHSYPHETDCHKYYVCDWGKPIEMICPFADANGNRLVFNPILQVCDWYDSAVAAGAVCPGGPPVTPPPVTLPPVTLPPVTLPPVTLPPVTLPPVTLPPVTQPPGPCPPNNEYYHSYPHETDCHKYYVCDWGKPIEMICPFADANGNRLVFNPILQVCDWYDSAVAAGAVCPGGPPVTPPPVTLPPVTLPPVTLPPVTLPPVTLPPVTQPPGPCPPNNEYYHSYPHETDCHKYYVCDWGKPIEMICPFADANGNRLVFNPILQVCDWYDSAVAAGAVCPGGPPVTPPPVTLPPVTLPPVTLPPVTLPPVTLPPVTQPPGPCPPNNEYYHSYPHETDCHKYYVCDWGKPIEMICPFADANGNRLVFNPILQVCDWYDSAVAAGAVCPGGPPVTNPPVTLPPVTLPPVTLPPVTLPPVTLPPVTQPPGPCPPNNEYYHSYPHETDCHKYYVCDWGKPIEMICPFADANGNRLVFNPILQVCDWYDSAVAAGAVCPGGPPVTPPPVTLPPVTLPPVTLPPVTLPPVTLPPVTLPPVTQPPGPCPPNNEYYHSYPHETDCHKYYVCDWGKPIEMICPFADANGNRLVFNPILQVCDWYDSAVAAGAVCPGGPPVTPPPVTLPPVTLPPVTLPPVTLPPVTLPPVTLPPVTLPPVTQPPGPCPPNNEYYHSYPHETDCHKYYVCDWGKSIEMICPFADANGNRLVFNPILQVCDWYDSAVAAGAVCSGGPPVTPPPVTPPPVTPPPVTPPPVTPPPVTPPPVTPPPVTAPPVTPPPVTPAPNVCPPNNEYYHSYPHETNCHKYYVCDWGKSIEMNCGPQDASGNLLVFNPVKQVCDWHADAVSAGAVCL